MNIRTILVLCAIGLLTACASKQVLDSETNKVKGGDVLTVSGNWIKNKGTKYDVNLNLENLSEKPVIILLGEMQCWKGSKRGVLRHTFFNTGERTIDFRPREIKSFPLVCTLGEKSSGEFKIVLGAVYEDKGNDGTTTGKTLVKNLEWKLADNF